MNSRFALSYDSDSNFVITRGRKTGTEATEPRYVGRPGVSAFRAVRSRELGVHFYPSPWLANRERVSLIFENEGGQIMEQELVPTARDWFALKQRLLAEPGVSSVRLSSEGVISIGYRGRVVEIVADYYTLPNAVAASANREIVFVEAGDRNGDGEIDYYSYYPNGDRQILFVRP